MNQSLELILQGNATDEQKESKCFRGLESCIQPNICMVRDFLLYRAQNSSHIIHYKLFKN